MIDIGRLVGRIKKIGKITRVYANYQVGGRQIGRPGTHGGTWIPVGERL